MNPDPLEQMMEQIRSLLHKVQESEESGQELPKYFDEQLDELEGFVDRFCKRNELTLKQLGLTEEQIQQAVQKTEELNPTEKRIFEKLKAVKADVESLQRKFAIAGLVQKQQSKNVKKGEFSRERKKKFRRMGGHEGWKPL